MGAQDRGAEEGQDWLTPTSHCRRGRPSPHAGPVPKAPPNNAHYISALCIWGGRLRRPGVSYIPGPHPFDALGCRCISGPWGEDMTLEQLRIFVTVAECLHMRRAAAKLNMTQSAVSAAIAALETRHSVRLFDRVGRGIELNADGRIFLDEARAVLVSAAAAKRALQDLSGLERGSISLYASQTIANYWLPARLNAYRTRHPKISVRVSIRNTEQVSRAVIEGDAELGFVEGAAQSPQLEKSRLTGDFLAVVVAPDHPWAGRPQIRPEELATSGWVLREPGSGTRSEFEEALAAHGVTLSELPIALELPSNEAIRAAVEAGAGAAAISHLVTEPAISAGRLRRVTSFQFPERPFNVLWHRGRRLTKSAEALLSEILEGNRPT